VSLHQHGVAQHRPAQHCYGGRDFGATSLIGGPGACAQIEQIGHFVVRQADLFLPSLCIMLVEFLLFFGKQHDVLGIDGQIAAALGIRTMEPFAPIRGEATVYVTWKLAAVPGQAELTDIFNMKQSPP